MESNFNRHLGSKLRIRRLALGLTQTKVAQAINVTFQQIQKYEKGTNGISSLRIMQLASFLKVPVLYFYEGYSAYEGETVSDERDENLNYYNFVADTIGAFRKAGLHYYNEAILVTVVGTLAIRVGNYFKTSRKLGKRHQNVLVFVKGDARKATKNCGECEFGSLDAGEEMGEVM